MRRIDTSRPGAADHEGPPLADCVDRSSPGLSGTTRPLEPILEQEESTLRFPVASTSPASTWLLAGATGGGNQRMPLASSVAGRSYRR